MRVWCDGYLYHFEFGKTVSKNFLEKKEPKRGEQKQKTETCLNRSIKTNPSATRLVEPDGKGATSPKQGPSCVSTLDQAAPR